MAKVGTLIKNLDDFQQRHSAIAFPIAVIKKYSDEEGGHLAALITYYGFLSLFPLLLVATTATQLFLKSHEHLRAQILDGINRYFPILSNDLQSNVHGLHKTGLALFIGILLTIYGARGGADAIRYALGRVWDIPKEKRPSFPVSILNSLLIILVGGGGLILASILSSYAAGLAHVFTFKIIPFSVSLLILVGVFYMLFSIGIARRGPARKDLLISSIAAAIGVQVLQLVGTYLLTHELRNSRSLYGTTFAVVLGLLFWIYLQAQVLLFAAFAGSVHSRRLWPRKLTS